MQQARLQGQRQVLCADRTPVCAVKDSEGKPLLYMELDPEDGRVIYQSEERLDLWANLLRETG